jgi:hypothetical protein
MSSRLAIVGAVLVAMLLWLIPVPGWAVVALLVALVPLGIALTVKRIRTERRLARTLWHALTGK